MITFLYNTANHFILKSICYSMPIRYFNAKVPGNPHVSSIQSQQSTDKVKVDIETIAHLERLSLVKFGNLKGVEIVESAIEFAEPLLLTNTEGVKPLTTVLENRVLHLREDIVKDGNCRDSLMANAKVTEEEYFVAPPGNIPLDSQKKE